MKNYSFDNIIKDKVTEHESPVPADAWNNITKQKKKRRGAFWWIFAALFIGCSLFVLYQTKEQQTPALSATETKDEKNVMTGKKEIIIADSKNTGVSKHREVIENEAAAMSDAGNERKENGAGENVKNKLLHAGVIDKHVSTISLTDSSVVNLTDALAQKQSIQYETGKRGTKNTLVAKMNKGKIYANKKVKEDDLVGAADKNKKTAHGKTNVKIAAPGIAAVEEIESTDTKAAAGKIIAVDPIPNHEDSSNITRLSIEKKQYLPVDTALKPGTKKVKRNKRTLFADISTMPFVPVQNNASLINIKRVTINSFSRSEFTTDEISTAVSPSVTYAFSLRKNITESWVLGTGVQYTRINETIKLLGKETTTNYAVVKRLDNSGSSLVNDTVATVTHGIRIIDASNSYDIFNIPVFIQYNVWQKKNWSLSLTGGFNFNVKSIYKNSIEGTLIPAYTAANKKQHSITTDLFGGMRLARLLGRNYSVYAEPTLQFNLQQYAMPGMINNKYIHRAGLAIGIAYQINY